MLFILTQIPLWVFPLFVLLLAIGLRASRTRRVPILLIAVLPLLGGLTVNNLLSLSPDALIWTIAIVSYALGIWGGAKLQKGWIIKREPRMVEIRGEWITLAAMMILFASGFAKGFTTEVNPALIQTDLFKALFTAITCLPAGQFLGRAITTLRTPVAEIA